jgi:hypothetical protein
MALEEIYLNDELLPSGGFRAELTDPQKAAIRKMVDLGRTLISAFSSMGEKYRTGSTLEELAEKYNLMSLYGISKDTARNVVVLALRGYDGRFSDFTDTAPYSGLLTAEEYDKIAKKHVREGAENQARTGQGFHAKTIRDKARLLAIQACGFTAWTDEEKLRAEELSQIHKKGSRVNVAGIAKILNTEFHKGEKVRNGNAITHILKKIRDDKDKTK